jgi:hypothetical protein
MMPPIYVPIAPVTTLNSACHDPVSLLLVLIIMGGCIGFTGAIIYFMSWIIDRKSN